MMREIYASSSGMENTISEAEPLCRSTPFTRVMTVSVSRSLTGTGVSATGQKLSKPLALVHCPSRR